MEEIRAREEMTAGAIAADRREPFQRYTTRRWQRGFTDRKRVMLAEEIGIEHYQISLPLFEALAAVCKAIRTKGDSASDLAQAIAFRVLEGEDLSLELAFDPNAPKEAARAAKVPA